MRALFPPIRFDWKVVFITIASTLLLIVDAYHNFLPVKQYDRAILYLFIPLFFILIVFRESPREYGFALGDWRAGLVFTLGGILLMTPVIWFLASENSAMQSYYGGYDVSHSWKIMVELIGWEFFFRGWILFGYARKFGPEAIWLQAVPFAMAHINKPEIETLSTIFGGFAFGWIAWRTKSFLYPFLIHWYIHTLIVLVSSGILP